MKTKLMKLFAPRIAPARVLAHRCAIAFGNLPSASLRRISRLACRLGGYLAVGFTTPFAV